MWNDFVSYSEARKSPKTKKKHSRHYLSLLCIDIDELRKVPRVQKVPGIRHGSHVRLFLLRSAHPAPPRLFFSVVATDGESRAFGFGTGKLRGWTAVIPFIFFSSSSSAVHG